MHGIILIENIKAIFSPEKRSGTSILIAGGVISSLSPEECAAISPLLPAESKIDAKGNLFAIPGLIDMHVHVTGGGGELGPSSRVPEVSIEDLLRGGITTVVGVLGTDDVSRSLENLLTKCRSLEEEGITAKMYCGSYRFPPPTLTGSVRRDLCLVEQVIGVGELAVSDHRGSQLTSHDIAAVAADCRVGGMLGAKAGILYCHMGPGAGRLKPLFEAISSSDIPITQIVPTHMERSLELVDEGIEWINEGGFIDFTTAHPPETVAALRRIQENSGEGLLERVSLSSDAGGSLPTFDSHGKLTGYTKAEVTVLHEFVRLLYLEEKWPMEKILRLVTKNPATILKLSRKGQIEVGFDADIVLVDAETLDVHYVISKGKILKTPTWSKKGMFSK